MLIFFFFEGTILSENWAYRRKNKTLGRDESISDVRFDSAFDVRGPDFFNDDHVFRQSLVKSICLVMIAQRLRMWFTIQWSRVRTQAVPQESRPKMLTKQLGRKSNSSHQKWWLEPSCPRRAVPEGGTWSRVIMYEMVFRDNGANLAPTPCFALVTSLSLTPNYMCFGRVA